MVNFPLLVENSARDIHALLVLHKVHPKVVSDVRRHMNLLVERAYEDMKLLEPGAHESSTQICEAIAKDMLNHVIEVGLPKTELNHAERRGAEKDQLIFELRQQVQDGQKKLEAVEHSKRELRRAHNFMLQSFFREVLILRNRLEEVKQQYTAAVKAARNYGGGVMASKSKLALPTARSRSPGSGGQWNSAITPSGQFRAPQSSFPNASDSSVVSGGVGGYSSSAGMPPGATFLAVSSQTFASSSSSSWLPSAQPRYSSSPPPPISIFPSSIPDASDLGSEGGGGSSDLSGKGGSAVSGSSVTGVAAVRNGDGASAPNNNIPPAFFGTELNMSTGGGRGNGGSGELVGGNNSGASSIDPSGTLSLFHRTLPPPQSKGQLLDEYGLLTEGGRGSGGGRGELISGSSRSMDPTGREGERTFSLPQLPSALPPPSLPAPSASSISTSILTLQQSTQSVRTQGKRSGESGLFTEDPSFSPSHSFINRASHTSTTSRSPTTACTSLSPNSNSSNSTMAAVGGPSSASRSTSTFTPRHPSTGLMEGERGGEVWNELPPPPQHPTPHYNRERDSSSRGTIPPGSTPAGPKILHQPEGGVISGSGRPGLSLLDTPYPMMMGTNAPCPYYPMGPSLSSPPSSTSSYTLTAPPMMNAPSSTSSITASIAPSGAMSTVVWGGSGNLQRSLNDGMRGSASLTASDRLLGHESRTPGMLGMGRGGEGDGGGGAKEGVDGRMLNPDTLALFDYNVYEEMLHHSEINYEQKFKELLEEREEMLRRHREERARYVLNNRNTLVESSFLVEEITRQLEAYQALGFMNRNRLKLCTEPIKKELQEELQYIKSEVISMQQSVRNDFKELKSMLTITQDRVEALADFSLTFIQAIHQLVQLVLHDASAKSKESLKENPFSAIKEILPRFFSVSPPVTIHPRLEGSPSQHSTFSINQNSDNNIQRSSIHSSPLYPLFPSSSTKIQDSLYSSSGGSSDGNESKQDCGRDEEETGMIKKTPGTPKLPLSFSSPSTTLAYVVSEKRVKPVIRLESEAKGVQLIWTYANPSKHLCTPLALITSSYSSPATQGKANCRTTLSIGMHASNSTGSSSRDSGSAHGLSHHLSTHHQVNGSQDACSPPSSSSVSGLPPFSSAIPSDEFSGCGISEKPISSSTTTSKSQVKSNLRRRNSIHTKSTSNAGPGGVMRGPSRSSSRPSSSRAYWHEEKTIPTDASQTRYSRDVGGKGVKRKKQRQSSSTSSPESTTAAGRGGGVVGSGDALSFVQNVRQEREDGKSKKKPFSSSAFSSPLQCEYVEDPQYLYDAEATQWWRQHPVPLLAQQVILEFEELALQLRSRKELLLQQNDEMNQLPPSLALYPLSSSGNGAMEGGSGREFLVQGSSHQRHSRNSSRNWSASVSGGRDAGFQKTMTPPPPPPPPSSSPPSSSSGEKRRKRSPPVSPGRGRGQRGEDENIEGAEEPGGSVSHRYGGHAPPPPLGKPNSSPALPSPLSPAPFADNKEPYGRTGSGREGGRTEGDPKRRGTPITRSERKGKSSGLDHPHSGYGSGSGEEEDEEYSRRGTGAEGGWGGRRDQHPIESWQQGANKATAGGVPFRSSSATTSSYARSPEHQRPPSSSSVFSPSPLGPMVFPYGYGDGDPMYRRSGSGSTRGGAGAQGPQTLPWGSPMIPWPANIHPVVFPSVIEGGGQGASASDPQSSTSVEWYWRLAAPPPGPTSITSYAGSGGAFPHPDRPPLLIGGSRSMSGKDEDVKQQPHGHEQESGWGEDDKGGWKKTTFHRLGSSRDRIIVNPNTTTIITTTSTNPPQMFSPSVSRARVSPYAFPTSSVSSSFTPYVEPRSVLPQVIGSGRGRGETWKETGPVERNKMGERPPSLSSPPPSPSLHPLPHYLPTSSAISDPLSVVSAASSICTPTLSSLPSGWRCPHCEMYFTMAEALDALHFHPAPVPFEVCQRRKGWQHRPVQETIVVLRSMQLIQRIKNETKKKEGDDDEQDERKDPMTHTTLVLAQDSKNDKGHYPQSSEEKAPEKGEVQEEPKQIERVVAVKDVMMEEVAAFPSCIALLRVLRKARLARAYASIRWKVARRRCGPQLIHHVLSRPQSPLFYTSNHTNNLPTPPSPPSSSPAARGNNDDSTNNGVHTPEHGRHQGPLYRFLQRTPFSPPSKPRITGGVREEDAGGSKNTSGTSSSSPTARPSMIPMSVIAQQQCYQLESYITRLSGRIRELQLILKQHMWNNEIEVVEELRDVGHRFPLLDIMRSIQTMKGGAAAAALGKSSGGDPRLSCFPLGHSYLLPDHASGKLVSARGDSSQEQGAGGGGKAGTATSCSSLCGVFGKFARKKWTLILQAMERRAKQEYQRKRDINALRRKYVEKNAGIGDDHSHHQSNHDVEDDGVMSDAVRSHCDASSFSDINSSSTYANLLRLLTEDEDRRREGALREERSGQHGGSPSPSNSRSPRVGAEGGQVDQSEHPLPPPEGDGYWKCENLHIAMNSYWVQPLKEEWERQENIKRARELKKQAWKTRGVFQSPFGAIHQFLEGVQQGVVAKEAHRGPVYLQYDSKHAKYYIVNEYGHRALELPDSREKEVKMDIKGPPPATAAQPSDAPSRMPFTMTQIIIPAPLSMLPPPFNQLESRHIPQADEDGQVESMNSQQEAAGTGNDNRREVKESGRKIGGKVFPSSSSFSPTKEGILLMRSPPEDKGGEVVDTGGGKEGREANQEGGQKRGKRAKRTPRREGGRKGNLPTSYRSAQDTLLRPVYMVPITIPVNPSERAVDGSGRTRGAPVYQVGPYQPISFAAELRRERFEFRKRYERELMEERQRKMEEQQDNGDDQEADEGGDESQSRTLPPPPQEMSGGVLLPPALLPTVYGMLLAEDPTARVIAPYFPPPPPLSSSSSAAAAGTASAAPLALPSATAKSTMAPTAGRAGFPLEALLRNRLSRQNNEDASMFRIRPALPFPSADDGKNENQNVNSVGGNASQRIPKEGKNSLHYQSSTSTAGVVTDCQGGGTGMLPPSTLVPRGGGEEVSSQKIFSALAYTREAQALRAQQEEQEAAFSRAQRQRDWEKCWSSPGLTEKEMFMRFRLPTQKGMKDACIIRPGSGEPSGSAHPTPFCSSLYPPSSPPSGCGVAAGAGRDDEEREEVLPKGRRMVMPHPSQARRGKGEGEHVHCGVEEERIGDVKNGRAEGTDSTVNPSTVENSPTEALSGSAPAAISSEVSPPICVSGNPLPYFTTSSSTSAVLASAPPPCASAPRVWEDGHGNHGVGLLPDPNDTVLYQRRLASGTTTGSLPMSAKTIRDILPGSPSPTSLSLSQGKHGSRSGGTLAQAKGGGQGKRKGKIKNEKGGEEVREDGEGGRKTYHAGSALVEALEDQMVHYKAHRLRKR